MGLKEQILNDMKTYMKNKDSVALGAIRMLNAEIKNAEIEKKRELKDEEIVNIISSAIKKRRESITFYQKGGRKDLLDKEEHEIKVLQKYLPEQLTDSELKDIIMDAINKEPEENRKNFGIIMKKVMSKVKGRAEGSKVNKFVKEIIDGIKWYFNIDCFRDICF